MSEGQQVKDKEKVGKDTEYVSVLAIVGDRVLTVRNIAGTLHGEGVWSLPGGKKRKINKESDREAAVRKFKQETGYDTTPDNLVEFEGNSFIDNDSGISWKVFICSDFSGEMKEATEHEAKPEWVSVKDLQEKYEVAPNTHEVITSAQRHLEQQGS